MLCEIPAAGWTAIAGASTLLITGFLAIIRERVVHNQGIKKEVFLRKLQTYEANITYHMEGLQESRSMFQNLRKLALDFTEKDLTEFENRQKEAVKQFDDLTNGLVKSIHIMHLYSVIRLPEPIQKLEYQLKLTAERLNEFPSDVKEHGINGARQKAAQVFDVIENIHDDMQKHYSLYFEEMQKDISNYL